MILRIVDDADGSVLIRYSPDQPRDEHGRFGEGDGGSGGANWAGAARYEDAMAATPEAQNLTPDAEKALGQYGRGHYYPDDKETAIHQHVNAGLREGHGDLASMADRDREVALGLDAAMSQTGGISSDIVVYRSASGGDVFGDAANGDMTGLSWRDQGFVSTSITDRAEDFQSYGGPADRVAMRVLVPAGTRGLSSPDLDTGKLDFDEVLLDRGLTFTVVGDNGMVNGAHEIDVRVG